MWGVVSADQRLSGSYGSCSSETSVVILVLEEVERGRWKEKRLSGWFAGESLVDSYRGNGRQEMESQGRERLSSLPHQIYPRYYTSLEKEIVDSL